MNKEYILKKLSKFEPISNNRFFWWRKYNTGESKISKKSSILDKIEAGYYDFPESYFYQSKLALIEWEEQNMDDIDKQVKNRNRYKRLMDDYHKDEIVKLERILTDFTYNYILKEDQVKDIMESHDGDIKSLYNLFEEKFRYPIKRSWKRSF